MKKQEGKSDSNCSIFVCWKDEINIKYYEATSCFLPDDYSRHTSCPQQILFSTGDLPIAFVPCTHCIYHANIKAQLACLEKLFRCSPHYKRSCKE
ncbi:unnamed protein product [Amoebophrya sp. A120]|nr:unnamed protein product [Amoebophrya sp. A120]|eukprot:GSA120T00000123001.1